MTLLQIKGPDGYPVTVTGTADGSINVSIISGGGGGGDASAANQTTQIAQLADILAEVTGAAKDTSVQDVEAAIDALGDGATIAEVVALLTTDAATQTSILAKLTDIEIDTTASAASLASLVTATDELEPDVDATRIAVQSIDGKTPALVSGRVPVDGSGVTQPVSGTAGATFLMDDAADIVLPPRGKRWAKLIEESANHANGWWFESL